MKAKLIYLSLLASSLTSMGALADARITVGHFAPFSDDLEQTSVSIALNGEVALENVKFNMYTDYIALPAGEYKVDVIPTGLSPLIGIMRTSVQSSGRCRENPLHSLADCVEIPIHDSTQFCKNQRKL